jgi:hypothetical protein
LLRRARRREEVVHNGWGSAFTVRQPCERVEVDVTRARRLYGGGESDEREERDQRAVHRDVRAAAAAMRAGLRRRTPHRARRSPTWAALRPLQMQPSAAIIIYKSLPFSLLYRNIK